MLLLLLLLPQCRAWSRGSRALPLVTSLTDAPLPCQTQLCFLANLEPTRMRWEKGQVSLTSLKTRKASVQECNGVKSVELNTLPQLGPALRPSLDSPPCTHGRSHSTTRSLASARRNRSHPLQTSRAFVQFPEDLWRANPCECHRRKSWCSVKICRWFRATKTFGVDCDDVSAEELARLLPV